jgi:hypothetical protein
MYRKNKEQYNTYMAEYMLKKYHRRRIEAIKQLGGKCVKCGTTNNLQLDHINPATKSFSISRMWSINEEKFLEELDKCQLLCQKCHNKKTIKEKGHTLTKGINIHGTLASYRYCKCDKCKKAKSNYNKEYKRKHKRP